jgi:hypothetical protein
MMPTLMVVSLTPRKLAISGAGAAGEVGAVSVVVGASTAAVIVDSSLSQAVAIMVSARRATMRRGAFRGVRGGKIIPRF